MIEMTFDELAFKNIVASRAKKVFNKYGEKFQSMLSEERREFPRMTIREVGRGVTGRVATSPRDVIDTGRLYDSYDNQVYLQINSVDCVISWQTPYATHIYTGYYDVPPFPWVQLGMREIDSRSVWNDG